MGHGGKRPNAGRKKGSPNKATAAKAAQVAASGVTPLDLLLQIMRDESADLGMRLDAAKAAAPYVHPKLHPVDGKTGGSEQRHVVQIVFPGGLPVNPRAVAKPRPSNVSIGSNPCRPFQEIG
jgi:hypothetical protein